MSLKLNLKESLFNILDYLPKRQGFFLYHKIQDIVNGKNMLQKVKSNQSSYETLKRLLNKRKISLKGKDILEIGSGWAPVMPYFMLYWGKAKTVSTFDLNQHFNKKNNIRLNEVFNSEYKVEVTPSLNNPYCLPKQINYYPNTNLIHADLPEVDVVFTRFVLEHVEPEDIGLIHQKFKKELKHKTTIIHLISPSDHRAYVDPELSLQDFLKYSKTEWKEKQTKFDYHNRLRLPQYLAIFKAAGLKIVHVEHDNPSPDSISFKKFKKVDLHVDFKNFSDEELTAGSINVILQV